MPIEQVRDALATSKSWDEFEEKITEPERDLWGNPHNWQPRTKQEREADRLAPDEERA